MSGESVLEEDDEVSFAAGVHAGTGAWKATTVQLLTKANGQSVKRDLGQVCTGTVLGSLVYQQASGNINTKRCSLVFSLSQ